MDIRQLNCFIAVAEHLSFTKAANALFLTQSAVSHQISSLERNLGTKVFRRDTHSVQLTQAGKLLFDTVSRMLKEYNGVVDRIRNIEAGVSGEITVGFFGAIEKTLLPKYLPSFWNENPEAMVHLKRYNLVELMQALAERELDIGFTISVAFGSNPAYHTHTLFEGRASVVMPVDHPLAERESLRFEDLRDVRMVAEGARNSRPALESLEATFAKRGFMPHIVQWANDVETVLMLVESGAGVAILSHHMVDFYPRYRVKCVDLTDEDAAVQDIVVWRKDTDNPLVPRFLTALGVPDLI
nr:LysR family transcriptional regulator [uncultured Holophaga sp.]